MGNLEKKYNIINVSRVLKCSVLFVQTDSVINYMRKNIGTVNSKKVNIKLNTYFNLNDISDYVWNDSNRKNNNFNVIQKNNNNYWNY